MGGREGGRGQGRRREVGGKERKKGREKEGRGVSEDKKYTGRE